MSKKDAVPTKEEIWASALNQKPSKGRARIKKSEMIYFPEFEAAADKATDSFWKDTLKLCARKKFPKGFIYNNGLLRHRTSNLCMNVVELDAESAAGAVTTFIRNNGRIYSPDDEADSKRSEDPILHDMMEKYSDWLKIYKSNCKRSQYVWSFAFDNFQEYSEDIRNDLFTKINMGFELGYLVKEDVVFECGKIVSIEGIAITDAGVEYMRNAPIKKRKTDSKPVKDKRYSHYENWVSYLEDLDKHLKMEAGGTHKNVCVIPPSSGTTDTLSSDTMS